MGERRTWRGPPVEKRLGRSSEARLSLYPTCTQPTRRGEVKQGWARRRGGDACEEGRSVRACVLKEGGAKSATLLLTLRVCLQAPCHALEQRQGHSLCLRTIVKDIPDDLDAARFVRLFEGKVTDAHAR